MTQDSLPFSRSRMTRLVVDGFRGIAGRVELDMDASAVLLWGPNGTGKTSVFDAMQWLLIGGLPRLGVYTLRKNEEYIVSSYSSNKVASVEAHFRLPTGSMIAKRVGNSQGSDLEVTKGDTRAVGTQAEELLQAGLVEGTLPLSEILMTSGLLQQDDLRQLLQTKPDERYRQLRRLLGLEVLERFDHFASTRLSRARDSVKNSRAKLDELQTEIRSLSERIETARSATSSAGDASVAAFNVAVQSHADLFDVKVDARNPVETAGASAAARDLSQALNRHLEALAALPLELPTVDESSILEASAEVESRRSQEVLAKAQLASAREVVTAVGQVQDSISRLAAAALPLLERQPGNAPCPVCETVVDTSFVASQLRARAEAGAAIASAERAADEAHQSLTAASEELLAAQRRLADLHNALKQRFDAIEALSRSLSGIEDLSDAGRNNGISLRIESPLSEVLADSPDGPTGTRAYEDWSNARSQLLPRLRRLIEGLNMFSDAGSAASSARAAAQMASERAAALPRQEAQLGELRERVASEEAANETLRRAQTAATTLAKQATAASAEIFREKFATLEPLMNDIYARLDPHPAFSQLGFFVETYRSKGTAVAQVVDEQSGITANPMLVFSSAQTNSVVLAAFLALGWAARERGLPFVLLDDPLQALDDVNVLGFADVARRYRRQRQLILATHEERFALLLERKLTGRTNHEGLLVHQFRGWSRSGPSIESRRVAPRTDLQLSVLAS